MITYKTTAKYQIDEKLAPPYSIRESNYNLYVLGGVSGWEILELGKFFYFRFDQPKKKLWGLFEGVKIEEEEIEKAKKSIFPEREF